MAVTAARVPIAISACVLGEPVRYDGGHKHAPLLTRVLGPFVEWVPLCPEVDVGLGVPRPPIRLERGTDGVRLVEPVAGTDLTPRMTAWAHTRIQELVERAVCGCILKSRSPSCGPTDVPVYEDGDAAAGMGHGVFAALLMARLPHLPVVSETQLHDVPACEQFLARARAYGR